MSFYVISGVSFPTTNLFLYIECIDSMDWSPSWEATYCSASQKFLRLLWNPMVHYLLHKRPTWSLFWTIKSNLRVPILLFKINCSIIFLSMHKSYKRSLSSTFCHQNLYAFPSSVIMMPRPSHPRGFGKAKSFWEEVKLTKSLIKEFSSTSYHFHPLASTYTPQQPVLVSCSSLDMRGHVQHHTKKTDKIIFLFI